MGTTRKIIQYHTSTYAHKLQPVVYAPSRDVYSFSHLTIHNYGSTFEGLATVFKQRWFAYWLGVGVAHYTDFIMSVIASQITSLMTVYSTVYSGVNQRKHQSSASLAFVWGIHRWPMNSPHKGPVTRKIFPFDNVIMGTALYRPTMQKCFDT